MQLTLSLLRKQIQKEASSERAKNLSWFFKTGPGGYAEGDIFVGISVPQARQLAKKFRDIPFQEKKKLLQSKIHEERMIAVLMFLADFAKADDSLRKKIFRLYIQSTPYINNWDLIDISAGKIVGSTFFPQINVPLLTKFAQSKSLWKKRIAMLATSYYIARQEFSEPLRIATLLLHDDHDLIQKAVGWMLREVGNKSPETEKKFLKTVYTTMPRTALRYAIEKFPQAERVKYLKGLV